MPAVLCWRSRVHNEASAHFAAGFGAALVRGETYSAAFEQVRRLRLRAGPLTPTPTPTRTRTRTPTPTPSQDLLQKKKQLFRERLAQRRRA